MDIIFFAAIAFYIFFKLREQLGKIDEGEKKQIEDKIAEKKKMMESLQNQLSGSKTAAEQIIVGEHKTKEAAKVAEVQNQANEKILATLDDNSKTHFLKALSACNISPEFFLSGAKSAFEMVIKAFASGNLETLKFLLAEKIYSGFEQSVNQRKIAEQTLISNLISIEKAEIISAFMLANDASVAVKFVSKQINYVTDKNGQIIEGKKNEIAELTDVWTFKKDVTVNNPNWIIVSTNPR